MPIRLADVRDSEGNPIDPDLQAQLEADGISTLEEARDRGRDHWIGVYASAAGIEQDFDGMLENFGVTWGEAANCEALQRSIWDFEISVAASAVLQANGVETFGDAFRRDRSFWREQLGLRNGMVDELDRLLAANGLAW